MSVVCRNCKRKGIFVSRHSFQLTFQIFILNLIEPIYLSAQMHRNGKKWLTAKSNQIEISVSGVFLNEFH